jgi:hypothetical protein
MGRAAAVIRVISAIWNMGAEMRHFSSEQWTDFVRETLEHGDAKSMQAHLDSGCDQCAAAMASWTRVSDLAAREGAYEPPAAAVKMAKASMRLHGQPARRPIAKLLFDSFEAPALAGVRSSTSGARQMLYGFDDYRVDLRFEPNFDADHAVLVGQVLNSEAAQKSLGAIEVALTRGGRVLGIAKTNQFGEFQMECDLGGRLELQLTLPDGEMVKVPMVEPSAHPATAEGPEDIDSASLKSRRSAKSKRTRK